MQAVERLTFWERYIRCLSCRTTPRSDGMTCLGWPPPSVCEIPRYEIVPDDLARRRLKLDGATCLSFYATWADYESPDFSL